ncbi:MAG: energy transducer TonB [Treponema sp.]|nr:energy transducer TonB [Treponema sp.]MCL2236721.1 energy transducer TonB [Treponema sp.]
MNEKQRRLLIFSLVAIVHIALILFLAFDMGIIHQEPSEYARVMKVTDLAELPPPPPPAPPEEEIPQVEDIVENMIESDVPIKQEVIAAGTLTVDSFENYLQIHQVSVAPNFDTSLIASSLVYPPIALRSGIEGRVFLELFVDRTGTVQRVTILREDPEGRGFGEAAVRAFLGRKGSPAYANGEPVSCRYRYPVAFTIR